LTPAEIGNLFFQPETSFTGTASFTYTATDQKNAEGNPAKVEITVTEPVNTPPQLKDDSAATATNTPVTVAILSNDSDLEGDLDLKSLKITTPPANGNVVIHADGTITFTPKTEFNGTETFSYEECDSNVPPACAQATVTLTVSPPPNTPPVADDKTVPAIPNNSIGQLTELTASDSDGTVEFYTILTLPPASEGILYLGNPATGGAPVSIGEILTPDQKANLFFQPNAQFEGTTQFTYTATDNLNAVSAPATVSISVTGAGELPPADGTTDTPTDDGNLEPEVSNDNAATNPNEPVKISILDNDSDSDNGLDRQSVTISILPKKGQVTVNTDGTVTYTPNPDFMIGKDTFVYRVCDSADPPKCDTAWVTVLVPIPENLPPVADDKTLSNRPNDQAIILPTLSATDSDGTIATYTLVTLPAKTEGILYLGDPAKGGKPVTAGQVLTLTEAANLFFSAKPNFIGTSQFTFTATDNEGAISDPATVVIPIMAAAGNPPIVLATLTVEIEGQGAVQSDWEGIQCGNGQTACVAEFGKDTPIALTAIPSPGWQFSAWSGDCDHYGQVTITADKQCKAVCICTC